MPDHTAWLGNLAGWHWEQVRHHLLLPKPKPEGGQPRVPDRQRFEGGLWIFLDAPLAAGQYLRRWRSRAPRISILPGGILLVYRGGVSNAVEASEHSPALSQLRSAALNRHRLNAWRCAAHQPAAWDSGRQHPRLTRASWRKL